MKFPGTFTKTLINGTISPYILNVVLTAECPKCRSEMNLGTTQGKETLVVKCPKCDFTEIHDDIQTAGFYKQVFGEFAKGPF